MKKENNKLIPKLRFREFEGEWQKDSTKKLVSFIKDGTHGTHKDTPDGGHYLLSAKNIVNGAIILNDDERKISKSEFDKITRSYRLKENDILVTIVGSIGQLALHKHQTNYAFQRSVAFLRFSKIEPKYAFHYLNSYYYQNELMKRKVTSAQPGIYLGELSKIDISFPSHPEQQKIASFLTAVDKLIEKLTKKKKLLEEYKKGIMQKIFNKEIRFKDKNRNDFPEWEEKRLGDLLKEYDQRTIDNNQFSILSSTAKGLFTQSEYFNHQVASSNNIGYKILKRGQLVFSPQNLWLGNININDKYDIGIVSPSYKVFDIRDNLISPQYMQELIKLPRMLYEYTISSEQGASVVRRNLNMELFEQIRINTPAIPEQKKIVEFSHKLNNQITNLAELLQGVQIYKQALLQQMFI